MTAKFRLSLPTAAAALAALLWMLSQHSLAANPWQQVSPQEIDWKTLLPLGERDDYRPAPSPHLHDSFGESGDLAALQTGSASINRDLNGARVKIPGFLLPLGRNAEGLVDEFLLVPYFGACTHVPPPPPNQIVHVKMRRGAPQDLVKDAHWITGTLTARHKSTPLGAAAYSLDGEEMKPYEY